MLRYRITPRRVLWLAEHLDEDSATAAAIRGGGQHRGWTTQTYLQAAIVDRLGEVWAAVLAPHTKRRPKAPAPVPRPKSSKRRAGRVVPLSSIRIRPPT